MWINISKWFQSIKTAVSHMMLAEVDNRFCFAAISYLSLAPPITAPWLLYKMAMVEGIKGTHGHSNIGVYSPRLSWPRPLLSTLVCQQQRPVQSLQCGTTLQGTSQLLRCRMVMLELLHHRRGSICSCWNRFLLWL